MAGYRARACICAGEGLASLPAGTALWAPLGTIRLGRGDVDVELGSIVLHLNCDDCQSASALGSTVLMDYVASETLATNIAFFLYFTNSGTQLQYKSESGAGTNRDALFDLNTAITTGVDSFVSVYRHVSGSTQTIRVYQDGVVCGVASVDALTDNTSFASGQAANGATSAVTGNRFQIGCGEFGDEGSAVLATLSTDATASAQLADHLAAAVLLDKAAKPATLPSGSLIAAFGGGIGGTTFGRGSANHIATLGSDMVGHCYISDYSTGSTWYAIQDFSTGEAPADNILAHITVSATDVEVLWESGNGDNRESLFALDTTLTAGYEGVISVYRLTNGADWETRVYQDGVQLSVSAVVAVTDNGTYTTGVKATGGSQNDSGGMRFGNPNMGADSAFCFALTVPAAVDQLADHDSFRALMPGLAAA